MLAASGGVDLEGVAAKVGLDATRAELVGAYAQVAGIAPSSRLAAVAAIAHRLERGLRLM